MRAFVALVLLGALSLGSNAGADNGSEPLAEPHPAGALVIGQGEFRDGDPTHRGSGDLRILQTPDQAVTIRLENLEVVPGPNLLVYLVREADPLFPEDVTDGFASLGPLKSLKGDQNYPLPSGLSLPDWGSVVVWCDTFKTAFAIATIE